MVQFVSAYLCFERAVLTGRRAYLHLAVACELSGVLAVGWALATQGVLSPDATTAGGAELTILGRVGAAVGFLVPVASAVVSLHRDSSFRVIADRTVATVAGTTLAVALLWVVLLGVHAAQEPRGEGVGFRVAWAGGAGLIATSVAMAILLRGYRGGSVLQRVLILVVALTGCAVALATFSTARFTVGWYAAHVYAILAAVALLITLLAHLHATDSERRRTVAELQDLRLVADAAYHEQRFQAGSDALTGVANRHHFLSELRRMIDSCTCLGESRFLALAVVDLDDFKEINDRCGHGVGDAVLQEIAFRISKHLGRADVVGRLGGDEFGVAFASEIRSGPARGWQRW